MCQLLGMNCATPTDFNFSFRGFCRRGGGTDKHSHGWGMAIYEGHGLRTFLDPQPAAHSKLAEFVENYPISTLNMMAHIRYATQGAVSMENVHPFQREMWGINFTFCHNGEVPKYSNNRPYHELGRQPNNNNNNNNNNQGSSSSSSQRQVFYHAVGHTDSEATFCAILNALHAEFTELPTLPVLYETLQRLCSQIVDGDEESTIMNFLLGCGPYTLFAYSWPGARPGSNVWNGLYYLVRKPPFRTAKLVDVDYELDFSKTNQVGDRVAVIATAPLTVDEDWKEFKRGELLMFDNGLAFSELYHCEEVEKAGRGLFSRALSKKNSGVQYDTPSQLRTLVDQVLQEDRGGRTDVWAEKGADLGCGTGCSGIAFRSSVKYMVGVDLSPEMVEKARQRTFWANQVYDELVVGNVECVLRQQPKKGKRCNNPTHGALAGETFDLIFACNVFCYIQDLKGVFEDVRRILNDQGGVFAFSAEFFQDEYDDDKTTGVVAKEENNNPDKDYSARSKPYAMQSCARYAHKRWYLEQSAREFGFQTKAFQISKLQRKHNGYDVYGALIVLTT